MSTVNELTNNERVRNWLRAVIADNLDQVVDQIMGEINARDVASGDSMPVERLELRENSKRLLAHQGVLTVGDLCRYSRWEILQWRNTGINHVADIESGLRTIGRNLRQDYATTETPVDRVPVSELDLDDRTVVLLEKLGIETLEELCSFSAKGLLSCRGIGRGTVTKIKQALKEIGRSLTL